jgi:hypothetical protein
MRKMAPHSAEKGRLGPSFFFLCNFLLLCAAVWNLPARAQEPIYRCGREYTNTPKDASRCERLSTQSVTVIPAIKPARGPVPAVPLSGAVTVPASPDDAPQRQRDQQARTIVAAELDKARHRQAELLQEYRQGAPAKTATEEANPQKYQERVTQLKRAIERQERDIDSLQRELARRPAP